MTTRFLNSIRKIENLKVKLTNIALIGNKPEDSQEEKLKKSFLIYMGLLMSGGALSWGGVSAYFGLLFPAIIPFTYIAITFLVVLWKS